MERRGTATRLQRRKTRIELADTVVDHTKSFHDRPHRRSGGGYRPPTDFENLPATIAAGGPATERSD
jgi:hypothetical protein